MSYDPDAPTKKVRALPMKARQAGPTVINLQKSYNIELLTRRSLESQPVLAKNLPSASLINLLFFEKSISLAVWSSLLAVMIILVVSLSPR